MKKKTYALLLSLFLYLPYNLYSYTDCGCGTDLCGDYCEYAVQYSWAVGDQEDCCGPMTGYAIADSWIWGEYNGWTTVDICEAQIGCCNRIPSNC